MKAFNSIRCIGLVLACSALVLTSGCGTSGTSSIISAGGAATGAAIGYSASNKNPYWTAGGAAGGVLVGALMNHKLQQQLQQAEQRGFDKAMNQSARQHYWMLQHFQKQLSAETDTPAINYWPIKRPEMVLEGVKLNETISYVPLYE